MSIRLCFKKISPDAILPSYQTPGSAGFDFHANEDVILKLGEVSLVPTGLSVEIPEGYEIQVRARSGLSAKWGAFLVNGVGTIDSDFRGEIKIIMSTCKEAVQLKKGERIAQGILAQVLHASILEAHQLSVTDRGAGGFGSTGR